MRALWLFLVLGALGVGCQCGPSPAVDGGMGGGEAMGGGAAGGGAGGMGGGGGALGGGAGGGDVDAGPDDAGSEDAGTGDAGADAGVDAGCFVTTNPAGLTFGPTAPGCASRQLITVSNACSTDAPVAVLTNGPFSVEFDGGAFTLDAGATAQVPILFQPTMTGAATGTASVTTPMSVSDVPLSGLGELMPVVTDSFRQPTRARGNLLVVVSDGPGMEPAQQALASSLIGLSQFAVSNQIDFRIGVIAGRLDGGTLIGGVMTQNRPNLQQQLASSVMLGSSGSPTVSCLERAVQELSDGGSAWLYARAPFSLLCVQNTLETPSGTVPAALQSLSTLVGNPTHFSVHALANFEPGCPPPDDAALRGAVDAGGGSLASICAAPDGGITMPSGRMLGDYEDTFFLSRKPEPGSIEVSLDGMVVPPVDPNNMTTLWRYDSARNAVIFAPQYVPAPGQTLTIRSSPACIP